MEVAKLSGFPLGIATRQSLKAIFALVQTSSTGYNDLYGRYFTIKDPKFEVVLNIRSLFMYCRRSVKGLAVAKARLAA